MSVHPPVHQLPKEPIDGYAVDLWEARFESGFAGHIAWIRYVYHARTRWEEHPWAAHWRDRHGVDFVHDWSVWSEQQHDPQILPTLLPVGRLSEWDSLREFLQKPTLRASWEEARDDLVRHLLAERQHLGERLQENRQLLSRWQPPSERKSS